MIDYQTARAKALHHLRKICTTTLTLEIVDSLTIEKPYGWVFFFNSNEYLESKDRRLSFLGSWPVIVLRTSGEIYDLQPSDNPLVEIEKFEQNEKGVRDD